MNLEKAKPDPPLHFPDQVQSRHGGLGGETAAPAAGQALLLSHGLDTNSHGIQPLRTIAHRSVDGGTVWETPERCVTARFIHDWHQPVRGSTIGVSK
jgi:hypothetical protein